MDLSKAFGCIPHGPTLQSCQPRKQRVKINDRYNIFKELLWIAARFHIRSNTISAFSKDMQELIKNLDDNHNVQ